MTTPAASGPMSGRPQPDRDEVIGDPRLRIVSPPLVEALLAPIRSRATPTPEFVQHVRVVGQFLIAEACRDVRLQPAKTAGFDGSPIDIYRLAERVAAVVVLRAGIVFAEPFLALLPGGAIYQVGAHRDEATLVPSIYTHNLPTHANWADRVLILDPMVATGGSVLATLQIVRAGHHGAVTVVALVAAPIGVRNVLAADPACEIVTAALDDRLDDSGYIRPGLGDAGDRSFGTAP